MPSSRLQKIHKNRNQSWPRIQAEKKKTNVVKTTFLMALQAEVVSPLKRWLAASLLNKLTLVYNIFYKVQLIVDIGLFINIAWCTV